MTRKHNVDEVLRALRQKKDLKIQGNQIQILRNSSDLGNGSWGKIDFLVNHQGYFRQFVAKL